MTDTVTVRLVYAGQRENGIRLFYAEGQEDQPEGQRAYSKKATAHAIGGVYTVEATDETAKSVYLGSLAYTGEGLAVDRDMVARWQLLDRQARGQADRDKAERRLAKSEELDNVIDPLLRFVGTLRTRGELDALNDLVRSRTTEAYWRKS